MLSSFHIHRGHVAGEHERKILKLGVGFHFLKNVEEETKQKLVVNDRVIVTLLRSVSRRGIDKSLSKCWMIFRFKKSVCLN